MSLYIAMLALHLLGATIWTGGHLALVVAVLPHAMRERNARRLLDFEQGFERIGLPALLVQVATGLWLAHFRLGGWGAIFSDGGPLATVVQVKLALLAATVGLAIHARLVLIPRLTDDRLPGLVWHIIPVTVLSVLFVLAGVAFRAGGFVG